MLKQVQHDVRRESSPRIHLGFIEPNKEDAAQVQHDGRDSGVTLNLFQGLLILQKINPTIFGLL